MASLVSSQRSTICAAASRYDAPLRTISRPAVQELHAALDVAAMIAAEAEHAGGDARRAAALRSWPVLPRGQRRGRRGAVIDERHQHRFHQAADARRRTVAHQQQVDRLAERQPAHHLVERIAAHEDLVRLDARQGGAPLLVRHAALPDRRSAAAVRSVCFIIAPLEPSQRYLHAGIRSSGARLPTAAAPKSVTWNRFFRQRGIARRAGAGRSASGPAQAVP